MSKIRIAIAAVAVLALTATASFAAIDFDPETGEGFVGKGEVQDAFDWNNRQLQQNAEQVQFRVESAVVTEVSWTCTNSNNDKEQVRERTTTTSVEGLVKAVARTRNQVTGFILDGYDGDAVDGDSETDGPAVNSCPNGPWTLTTSAGDPEVVSDSTTFQVSIGGENWIDLPGQDDGGGE